jgi:hypothetical protein
MATKVVECPHGLNALGAEQLGVKPASGCGPGPALDCVYSSECNKGTFYKGACDDYAEKKAFYDELNAKAKVWFDSWVEAGETEYHLTGLAKVLWDIAGALLLSEVVGPFYQAYAKAKKEYGSGGSIYDCNAKPEDALACVHALYHWYKDNNCTMEQNLVIAAAMLTKIVRFGDLCAESSSQAVLSEEFFGVADNNEWPAGNEKIRVVYNAAAGAQGLVLRLKGNWVSVAQEYNEVAKNAFKKWSAYEKKYETYTVKVKCVAEGKTYEYTVGPSNAPLGGLFHSVMAAHGGNPPSKVLHLMAKKGKGSPFNCC